MTAGERSRPLTFDELAPLLMQEEAREHIFNQSDEKHLVVKDKEGKGKPKNSQPRSSDANKSWKKNIKCWYNKVLGHMAKECRKKKADLKWKKEGNDTDSKFEVANVTTG